MSEPITISVSNVDALRDVLKLAYSVQTLHLDRLQAWDWDGKEVQGVKLETNVRTYHECIDEVLRQIGDAQ